MSPRAGVPVGASAAALVFAVGLTASCGGLPGLPATPLASERERLETACGWGRALDCHGAGLVWAEGGGVAAAPDKARPWFTKGCGLGHAPACTSLGLLDLASDGDPVAQGRGVERLDAACRANDAEACFVLARAYDTGQRVPPDAERGQAYQRRALELDWPACEAGGGAACVRSAYVLFDGLGVPADPVGAITLFEEACAYGEWLGCSEAGAQYRQGGFVRKDFDHAADLDDEAVRLLESRCALGWFASCEELGRRFYANRGGLYAQPAKAERVLRRACGGGRPEACVPLAGLYADGSGSVSQDLGLAQRLFEHACAMGSAAGCEGAAAVARGDEDAAKDASTELRRRDGVEAPARGR